MYQQLYIILFKLIWVLCDPSVQSLEQKKDESVTQKISNHLSPVVNVDNGKSKQLNVTNDMTTTLQTQRIKQVSPANGEDLIQTGALYRGFLVLLAITLMLIAYFVFRMYRIRSKKRNPIVVKYGVLTNRSDIEMEPLPLSEDDDDDTVFEINGANNHLTR